MDFNDHSYKWWLESYWNDGRLFLLKKIYQRGSSQAQLITTHQVCLFVSRPKLKYIFLTQPTCSWPLSGDEGALLASALQYIYQLLHTATLCIQLAGDISLETKRQPSRDRELSRQDRVQYILRIAGIWRNALSNSGPICVLSWGCPLQRVTYNKWSLG